jgi:hypothetical protein
MKHDLPWRRRQQGIAKKAWWSRIWESRAAWASAFVVIGAILSFVLTQGVESLKNVRILPSELRVTYHSLLSWYFDDSKWTGTWSSREEGDVQDYQPSKIPLKITFTSDEGKVFGEMFNRSVCDLSPMLPPIMVEGEIHRGKMVGYAYAYVGGEKNLLYTFVATRSDTEPVLTLSPLRDPHGLLPSNARLVLRYEAAVSESNQVSSTQISEHPDLECPESSLQYLQRLRKEGKLKSVEELGIARKPKTNTK